MGVKISLHTVRPRGVSATPSLLKRRAWFDDAPPSGNAGTPPPTPEPGKPTPDKTGTPPDKTEGQDGKQELKFTQEQLDALFADRASKAKQSGIADLLKKLGVETPEALEQVVKAHTDAQEASKSELQKAAERADKAEAKVKELEGLLAEEKAGRTRDKLENAVTLAASGAGSQFPEDVWTWLNTHHTDDLAKAMGEDGKLNDKAIASLIGKVKEARPNFFAVERRRTPGSPSNSSGRVPEPGAEADKQARAQVRSAVRKSM